MNTRDHILDQARKAFKQFGFNKTSVADIATAARKGRRTIYTYFTSKEEVFQAVIEVEVQALAAKLQVIIDSDISPREKLRTYMHARMNAVKELTIYYDALRQDLQNNLGMIEKIRKEYDVLETNMIKEILDEGMGKEVFAIDDTYLVANAIMLATKGFELPLYMGQTGYDHEQFIDPLINLFYRGILKPTSQH